MKKYTIDTNVLLSDPNATVAFDGAAVILPFTVLEELDSIKSRNVDVSRDARFAIRNIDAILKDATHEEISSTGVNIANIHKNMDASSKLFVMTNEEAEALIRMGGSEDKVETLLKSTVPDDKIILVALASQSVLVTRDINMRIKAMSYGVEVQDYRHDVAIEDSELIHIGQHHLDIDFWKTFSEVNNAEIKSQQEGRRLYHYIPTALIQDVLPDNLCIGDYLYDNADVLFVYEGQSAIEEEDGSLTPEDILVFQDIGQSIALRAKVWDIKAKNIQQALAINSILDPDVHLTVLLGSAGTGKTLITVATSLELVLEKRKYDRIIFSKTQDSQFEEIGFLPGSEAEKVIPFCGAAIDALEYLHKDDANPQGSIEEILKRNVMQFKALNFIRGRSFTNTILIVDEFQNITPAQAKTILTRAGQNCKVIIMGNLAQIDSKFISPVNSGLTYVTEKFKDWEGCRIIELEGVVRSALAEFAEENM
ncbi:PhoH family protein [Escherichia coli]|nr:PhoH family protein [Escherichia coli]EFL4883737.1 PhoH family protein [Escherichia coli]MED6699441.1 PhoH family protein [Escherichia coli O157]USL83551.1 PhoH-like protein [Escherichia phage A4]HCQ0858551.1 PhoH family protein [Escherichia coli]